MWTTWTWWVLEWKECSKLIMAFFVGQFFVEKIVKCRQNENDSKEYFIKWLWHKTLLQIWSPQFLQNWQKEFAIEICCRWLGYDASHNSWELASKIPRELLEKFEIGGNDAIFNDLCEVSCDLLVNEETEIKWVIYRNWVLWKQRNWKNIFEKFVSKEQCGTLKERDDVRNRRDRTAGIQVFIYPCLTSVAFIELFKAESLSQLWWKLCQLVERYEGLMAFSVFSIYYI